MIYSVYNWDNGAYDYYENRQPMPVADAPPKTRATLGRTAQSSGLAADDIATALPKDVKHVGSGAEARGAIAVSGVSALEGPSWVKIGLLVGSAFLLMKVLK